MSDAATADAPQAKKPPTLAFYRRTLAYFRDDRRAIVGSLAIILTMNLLGVIWPVPLALISLMKSASGTGQITPS
ncbi:MAG: hypothetical protein EOP70_18035, partial [Variovorax sp.]